MRRQGAGQGRRPRQGRRRQARQDPRRGRSSTRRDILGMDIKGLTVNRVLVAPAATSMEEYYFSFLLDRANRSYLCIAQVEGGVEIEEVAETNPDAVKQIPIDPGTGVDEAKAREIVDRGRASRPRCVEQAVDDRPGAVEGLRRGGRHPGRGQPAGAARAATSSRRSTARSRSTTTPSSATPTTREFEDQGRGRPARGEGQGEGPQLRQARRRRSASSATARAGHVDPRRRRLRR